MFSEATGGILRMPKFGWAMPVGARDDSDFGWAT